MVFFERIKNLKKWKKNEYLSPINFWIASGYRPRNDVRWAPSLRGTKQSKN